MESMQALNGGESQGITLADGALQGQTNSDVPEPKPEDSTVTKAELLERRLDNAENDLNNDRPLKKPRLESDLIQGQVTKERIKGVAPIKPEYGHVTFTFYASS